MSIHKSYFTKNNTILSDSPVNTAKNPVTELLDIQFLLQEEGLLVRL